MVERVYFARDNEGKRGTDPVSDLFVVVVIITKTINISDQRLCLIPPCGPV